MRSKALDNQHPWYLASFVLHIALVYKKLQIHLNLGYYNGSSTLLAIGRAGVMWPSSEETGYLEAKLYHPHTHFHV